MTKPIRNSWVGRQVLTFHRDLDFKLKLYDLCRYIDPFDFNRSESLYIGKLSLNLIVHDYAYERYLPHIPRLKDNVIETEQEKYLDYDLFFLYKLCMLTADYLEHKKFNDPVMTYFNPYSKKINIHPGIGRYVVLSMLNEPEIKTIYFNTGGSQLYLSPNLLPISLPYLMEKFPRSKLGFLADYGSLIPQIVFPHEMLKFTGSYHKIFCDLKVICNMDIEYYKPYISPSPDISIEFKPGFSSLDVIRGLVFSALKYEYQSENLKITILN